MEQAGISNAMTIVHPRMRGTGNVFCFFISKVLLLLVSVRESQFASKRFFMGLGLTFRQEPVAPL